MINAHCEGKRQHLTDDNCLRQTWTCECGETYVVQKRRNRRLSNAECTFPSIRLCSAHPKRELQYG